MQTWKRLMVQNIGLPSELWNSDIDSIFLPKTASVVNTNKSGASASRILTSPEIIQAEKEKAGIKKKQKAKAA